jgi:broad specificity phosphatase PhoE
MTQLFLCRHAEVEDLYHRRFGGTIDMALSAWGHTQAQALARWLSRHRFDAVYASPMQRVQLTLEPFRPQFQGEPVILDGLREVDFGAWTGCGWDEVETRFGMSAFDWLKHLETDAIPEGETLGRFHERVAQALERILRGSTGRQVAVYAHGGVIRMALAILLDLPLRKFEHFEIDYASATWLDIGEIKAGRPRTEIQLLNFTPWRDTP